MQSECCTVVLPAELFAANGNVGLNCLSQSRGQPQNRYERFQSLHPIPFSRAYPAALASALSSCTLVSAEASGPTLTLTSTANLSELEVNWNGMLGYNPFEVATTGPAMIGGATTSTVADVGTLTLTVNGTQIATAAYGTSSTPSSIASALAAGAASNSLVAVSASGSSLALTALAAGSSSDYSYSFSTTSAFSTPSFSGGPPSGYPVG